MIWNRLRWTQERRVLELFAEAMQNELDENAPRKGDRRLWRNIDPMTLVAEVSYHNEKLAKAVADGDEKRILEHAADVANLAMMVADSSGCIDVPYEPEKEPQARPDVKLPSYGATDYSRS